MRARGAINRRDFGLTWQKQLETGGFLSGEEVRIMVDISAVKAES
jgi:polyisoprenoid-binding protein YceI